MPDERPTLPPGPPDERADAFAALLAPAVAPVRSRGESGLLRSLAMAACALSLITPPEARP